MHDGAASGRARLAELVAALSLGIDLGFAQPMEHVLRQCLIALRLAERAGLGEQARAEVYYTALLVNVGCHSDAHEQAKWFGDDIALKAGKYRPVEGVSAMLSMLSAIGAGRPPLHRLRIGFELLVSGRHELTGMIASHAKLAQQFATELKLPTSVASALGSAYEHWNGSGWPGKLDGKNIPIAARIANLAEFLEVAHRVSGTQGALDMARKRRGRQFDPTLSALTCQHASEIFADLDAVQAWDAVIKAEPALAVVLSDDELDAALLAVANFVDLKSPYTLGHSSTVADLCSATGTALGLPASDVRSLRRAGLVHNFGRMGVSNAIWDKPTPLGAGEWERVRMQPYFTNRMLHQSTSLAPFAAIAVQHRERLDGSGYPRGAMGKAISVLGRIVAVADAYRAMREPRAHREAHSADEAARLLRADVRAGKLDGEVVEALLGAAGHRAARRSEGPAGLTAREIEVLRLLARGLSTKQIGAALTMSAKTASNHIEHIYSKIQATNRVSASLFAVQHGFSFKTRKRRFEIDRAWGERLMCGAGPPASVDFVPGFRKKDFQNGHLQ